MHIEIFRQVIYWSPIPVLAALIVIFLRRRLTREFPLFFTYVVVSWAKNIAQLVGYIAVGGNFKSVAYTYTYWCSQFVSAIFMLLATYELAFTHLFPRYYKVGFYRYLFPLSGLVILGFVAFALYGGSGLGLLPGAVYLLDVLQVLAMLFFVALMQFMGRRWSGYHFAIAAGLGLNSIGLVAWIVVFLKSRAVSRAFSEAIPMANTVAFLVWLIVFLRPQRLSEPVVPVSLEVLDRARIWEALLRESLSRR
jgi:hypothetical protein